MIFGSVCSGIEAASVAWRPLGWRAAFVSETAAFPRAVLQHRQGAGTDGGPTLHGDFTTIEADSHEPIDLLCGGTPCQSYSVAGKRAGLDDPRGELSLEFCALAQRLRPRWIVWENVPGVLSSNKGRDFAAFLRALAECGYGWAYRVLDAQYFGLAQRRKRVVLVGHTGGAWQRAAAVLFEPEGMRGDPPPRRETGEGPAAVAGSRPEGGVCGTLSANGKAAGSATQQDAENGLLVPVSFKASHYTRDKDGAPSDLTPPLSADADKGDQDTLVCAPAVAFDLRGREGGAMPEGPHPTANIRAASGGSSRSYVAFDTTQITSAGNYSFPRPGDPCHPLAAGAHPPAIAAPWAVRRLTPRECERLQGFPDDYTAIPWRGKPAGECPDGPRYKALGNSWAVPKFRWVGARIAFVDRLEIVTGQAA